MGERLTLQWISRVYLGTSKVLMTWGALFLIHGHIYEGTEQYIQEVEFVQTDETLVGYVGIYTTSIS